MLSNGHTDLRVLDLGCGEKPYKPYFKGTYSEYIGLDPRFIAQPEIVATGEYLPFRNEVLDVCICTQMLEHSEEPNQVVSEIYRILRNGGILFLSTHGIWPIHTFPKGDYWR